MPIFYLIFFTYAIFLLLWTADLYFTVQSVGRLGKGVEVNPVLRFIIGLKGRHIWSFKVVEVFLFTYIIWAVSNFDEGRTFSFLLGLIFVYLLVVIAGLKVYIDLTGKSTPVIILFFGLGLMLLLFVHLNYVEYTNKVAVSNALAECGSKYSEDIDLFKSNISSTTDYQTKDHNLNLSIPKVTL